MSITELIAALTVLNSIPKQDQLAWWFTLGAMSVVMRQDKIAESFLDVVRGCIKNDAAIVQAFDEGQAQQYAS